MESSYTCNIISSYNIFRICQNGLVRCYQNKTSHNVMIPIVLICMCVYLVLLTENGKQWSNKSLVKIVVLIKSLLYQTVKHIIQLYHHRHARDHKWLY